MDWLLGHLKKRAFVILLLILAIAILIPGLGIVSSIAIAFPAVEMAGTAQRCRGFSPNVRLHHSDS